MVNAKEHEPECLIRARILVAGKEKKFCDLEQLLKRLVIYVNCFRCTKNIQRNFRINLRCLQCRAELTRFL